MSRVSVEVTIIPTGPVRRPATVEDSYSVRRIKRDVVEGLRKLGHKLGDPEEYEISFAPASDQQTASDYRFGSGDRLVLIQQDAVDEPAVIFP